MLQCRPATSSPTHCHFSSTQLHPPSSPTTPKQQCSSAHAGVCCQACCTSPEDAAWQRTAYMSMPAALPSCSGAAISPISCRCISRGAPAPCKPCSQSNYQLHDSYTRSSAAKLLPLPLHVLRLWRCCCNQRWSGSGDLLHCCSSTFCTAAPAVAAAAAAAVSSQPAALLLSSVPVRLKEPSPQPPGWVRLPPPALQAHQQQLA